MKIAIIGAGHMGRAIADGLLSSKIISSSQLVISNPSPEKLQHFSKRGIQTFKSNRETVTNAEIVILSVKPQVMHQVLKEIEPSLSNDQLILSIAAGIPVKTIEEIVGPDKRVVRAMPNLCATVGESMTCWLKNANVDKENTAFIRKIFSCIGKELELESEETFDAVTPLSGSGPAYLFYLEEILIRAGEELGLRSHTAAELVRQTLIGAVKILTNSGKSPHRLRQEVTSNGGVTEAAFKIIDSAKIGDTFSAALRAARDRSKELSSDVY